MESPDFTSMRTDYLRGQLSEDVSLVDPIAFFALWMAEAEAAGIREPNAMVLATADRAGRPSARMVLAKSIDAAGIRFFTNRQSRKGGDLAENPQAAVVFDWRLLERQVRVEGPVQALSEAQDDIYFASRPLGAQIGAAASRQSRPIADRLTLDSHYEQVAATAGQSGQVMRPAAWGGYQIAWQRVEFWQGRDNRMHDRIVFTRTADSWLRERLQP